MLEAYEDIFKEPQGLPSTTGTKHRIMLKPVSVPKSQHPYRISHDQKDEVEKIVQELLDNGVIQHGKSPFASSILLVKTKDGTWKMCVDYWYLNDLIVKHEYPIPVIDKRLDEL